MSVLIDWILPIKLVSPNIQEHWTKKYKRNKQQEWIIKTCWLTHETNVQLPCIVTLTRLAPREFDYDNMVPAFKHVKDSIADLIIPGLAPGRADGSKQIEWRYEQEKAKKQGIRIQICPMNVS